MFSKGLTFDDVLLVPKYNGIESRAGVSTETILGNCRFKIPVVSANMDSITGPEMARKMWQLGGLGILHRFMSIEDNVKAYLIAAEPVHWQHPAKPPGVIMMTENPIIGVSVGVNEGLERAQALYENGARLFCVDVAHGHSKQTGRMVKMLREKYAGAIIIAGNVATYAGADYLVGCGADVIKVGIGPGSVCSTRVKTGFGVPQLTAIMECNRISRPIIADGGIRCPGDAVKALAAGARMVMLGGMLAGTLETPGEIIYPEGEGPQGPIKTFRGMASLEAQQDFYGNVPEWKTAEGVSLSVPAKGSVEDILQDVMGGIRSGMTYSGALTLEDLHQRAEFIQVSQAAYLEGLPHAKGK